MSTTASETVAVPKRIAIPKGQLLIKGKWRDARDGATMPTTDPTTEEVITNVAKASAEDAQDAINAACTAFDPGSWYTAITALCFPLKRPATL